MNRGDLLNSCGCFYCGDCFRNSKSYINIEKASCMVCSKPVDFSRAIEVNNKESVKKIEFIFDEPEVHLKKVIDCLKVKYYF